MQKYCQLLNCSILKKSLMLEKVHPCSHVGHVYRDGAKPYENSGEENLTLVNYKRFAEVWMDEFKELFYMVNPAARNIFDFFKKIVLKYN